MAKRFERILIVEDDYFLASDLTKDFRKAGLEIVGPVGSLARARALVEADNIDGAVLDIKLDQDTVYEMADALLEQKIPTIFVTGYDRSAIPARYAEIPVCLKPIDGALVVEALRRVAGR